MITYELTNFKQKGIGNGVAHYRSERFNRLEEAKFHRTLYQNQFKFYTLTRLNIKKDKVIGSELIECR